MTRRIAFIVALAVCGLAGTREAKAQATPGGNWFGIVTIENKTDITLNYDYVNFDGQWHSASIEPGAQNYYWYNYEYQNENASPPFGIRFDGDLSEGVAMRQYTLGRNSAAYVDADFGRKYDFRYQAGHQVNLFSR